MFKFKAMWRVSIARARLGKGCLKSDGKPFSMSSLELLKYFSVSKETVQLARIASNLITSIPPWLQRNSNCENRCTVINLQG